MRFLSFEIKKEGFGLELSKVKEVVAFPKVTPTPGTPKKVLGLMCLRDQVIPLVDLRICLGIEPTLDHDTAVIVCEIGTKTVGLVVDVIQTVMSSEDKQVIEIPQDGTNSSAAMISKVIRMENHLILILNLESLIGASEMEASELHKASEKLRREAS